MQIAVPYNCWDDVHGASSLFLFYMEELVPTLWFVPNRRLVSTLA